MFPTLPVSVKAQIVSQPFKRSQLGLFQGKTKQYGNNVPFSKHKTRRTWLPNVQRKRFPSEALGENVRVKVTTRALKTIKKHKGIDNYVLNTRHEKLGWEGMRIRLMVREALKNPRIPGETPEARATREAEAQHKLAVDTAMEERRVAIRRLRLNTPPSLDDARLAREAAVEALGGSSKPSQILHYLRKQKEQQKTLLGSRRFSGIL